LAHDFIYYLVMLKLYTIYTEYAYTSLNIDTIYNEVEWINLDCGPLPELNFGQYKLVNGTSTVFGSVANVICDSGYTSDKLVITCQSSAIWETAVCSINGNSTVLYHYYFHKFIRYN
jgi:L-cysteine desulfidase